MANDQYQRMKTIWKSCLVSAFRTSLACAIVGAISLYSPCHLKNQIAFPAFSYVTVILIITNATLGDTIHSCWLAFYATIQTVCPAILCLWIIKPTNLTTLSTSLILTVSAFFVVLPEWTHLLAKRIALGQLVIIYVIGYIDAEHINAVMHPVHVAACTAVGVVACVLAMILPYPQLAFHGVKWNCKVFGENAAESVKLFVKAFFDENKSSLQLSLLKAKFLAIKGNKVLRCIKDKQESVVWETLSIKFLEPYRTNPGDRSQELERVLRGMEMALSTGSSMPKLDKDIKDKLTTLQEVINQNLADIKSYCLPCASSTIPPLESNSTNHSINFFQTLKPHLFPPTDRKDLSHLFFLFCLNLLQTESNPSYFISAEKQAPPEPSSATTTSSKQQSKNLSEWIQTNWPKTLTQRRLIPGTKSSLSLGLAVLLGLIYSKDNGYWSGLPVAITLAASREPTFRVANVKAQGTVIGTVYGVLGCFVFERFVNIRFVALLPWFVVTSFLQRSKMYAQAGAVSAAIGAVLILGRKDFGTPSEFAIARIVETFIGLSCSVLVELLFQPKRAASLAKIQVSETLGSMQDCCDFIDIVRASESKALDGRVNELKESVTELRKLIEEAEVEPDFWFMPFHSSCYKNLLKSQSKIGDLLFFTNQAIRFVQKQKLHDIDMQDYPEYYYNMNDDLRIFREMIGSYVECLKQVLISIESLDKLEIEKENIEFSADIESGGKSNSEPHCLLPDHEEVDMQRIMNSFLEHLKEIEYDEETQGEIVLCFSAIGYCMGSMMKEIRHVGKEVKELVQWENSLLY